MNVVVSQTPKIIMSKFVIKYTSSIFKKLPEEFVVFDAFVDVTRENVVVVVLPVDEVLVDVLVLVLKYMHKNPLNTLPGRSLCSRNCCWRRRRSRRRRI